MKKLRNVILLTSAAALTLFPGCTKTGNSEVPQVEPERIDPDTISFGWQEPYRRELDAFKSSEDFDPDPVTGSAFDLLDLDGDHSPELVISTGTTSLDMCRIYTCKNGSAEPLGEVCKGGSLEWLPEFDMFHDEYVGESFIIGNYYSLMDDVYTGTIAYNRSTKMVNGEISAPTINGKEYLLPDFEEELRLYNTAYTVVRGRKYSFGDEAVKLALNFSESWSVALNIGEKELFRKQLRDILEAVPDGSGRAFELCDLSGDGIPELIVSEGAKEAKWSVYSIDDGALRCFDGVSSSGDVRFDISGGCLYYLQSEKKWLTVDPKGETADKAVIPEKVENYAVLGRQYDLKAENIDIALN